VEDKISALFVRHSTIGIIRVLAPLELDLQFLILFVSLLVKLEIIVKHFRANQERESPMSRRVQDLLEEAFNVRRPTFVEPKV
jgi:hypothetical protein